MCEIVRSEAPEVHGNGGGVRDSHPVVIIVKIFHDAVEALNLGAFHYGSEVMVLIVFADAAADGSAFAQRVSNAEADHGIFSGGTFGKFGEPLAHHLESVSVIEVIAVEHGKRLFDDVLTHHDCVVGSPGFGAFSGAGETFGQCIEGLENEFAGDVSFIF